MTYFNSIFGLIAAFILSSNSLSANEFYSCEYNGKEASYHQDEVPRMKSLGAACIPLNAATRLVCSIGSVSSIFSVSEAEAVLNSSNKVSCASGGILIASGGHRLNPVVVASEISVLVADRPAFELQKTVVLYFRLGSAKLSKAELSKIAETAQYYGTGFKMTILGHTDSTGSAAKNHLLSFQRAGAVRDALIRNNVDASDILSVSAMGEESLRYQTEDGIALGANRAVEIRLYR